MGTVHGAAAIAQVAPSCQATGSSRSEWEERRSPSEDFRGDRDALSCCYPQLSIQGLTGTLETTERAARDKSFNQMLTNPCRHIIERLPWQFYYWSGVVILFAWAAWQRFALPLDPIADPDTWGYLSPALRKLIGAEFGHTHGRNFIYPGFLFLLLRAFGDFRAITITQHFLGLFAGAILLLSWRRARFFVPNPRVGYAGHAGLGLLAAAIFLLASEPMRFEMQLRPEGISAFLISVNMYVVIQFTACCFIERRRVATAVYGITAVFTSILLASVKPSFALAAMVALLPIGIIFFRQGWFRQKILLAGGAAASAALLLLPERFLSRNDEVSQTFLPSNLFAIHANLIRDQMGDDLRHSATIPYPRQWIARVHGALSAEIEKSIVANHYRTLGFDPDYLMYGKYSIAAQLRREFGGNVSTLRTFYWFYYDRIWRQRPLLILKKITRQLAIFYRPVCPAYNRRKSWPLTDVYKRSIFSLDSEPYRKILAACPPATDFMRRTEILSRSAPTVQQPRPIRFLLDLLAITYLPLLLSALALGLIVLLQADWRKRLGWLAALVLLGYLYNAGACFEVAVIQSLETRRYITVQMFLTLLVQFLALWFVLEFAVEMRGRQKHRFLMTPDTKDITDGARGSGSGGHNSGNDHTISARFCSGAAIVEPPVMGKEPGAIRRA